MSGPTGPLHACFDASVARFPDRVAVDVPPATGRTARLTATYAELDRAARSIGAGIGSWIAGECVVAILLPRDSHLLFAAQIAVLRAGAAFVCPDVAFPDDWVRHVLDDARAVAVVTDAAGRERLRGGPIAGERILDVTAVAPAGRSRPCAPPWLGPHSLAYVIYTSGTSGRPKGVMIEHHSVVNLVDEGVVRLGFTPDDRVAQGSSSAYDSSIEETWLAFAAGATVVVMDDDAARLGPDLVPWLRDERITVWMPTPTMLRTTGCERPSEALPDLRLVYAGGEAIPPAIVARWADGIRFENGYGPTECTVTVVRGPLVPGEPVTIGTPVRGNTVRILDARLEEVAAGCDGELCIAGESLARGYLGSPELTRERFVEHPRHGRIYRTGDLARRDPDGRLRCLGRIDSQVKVRGHRIELEAVEAVLSACPGVRAAACAVQGAPGHEHLAAFVVPADAGSPPVPELLLARLAERLPVSSVPSGIAVIDALPVREASGKLDRTRLPELAPPERGAPPIEPRDPLERRIAHVFEQVLRADAVSINDDFFDLGGDSVRAAELVSLLREDPTTDALAVRDLYLHRTVAGLAGCARTARVAQGRELRSAALQSTWTGATLVQTAWLSLELFVAAAIAYLLAFELLPRIVDALGPNATLLLAPVAFWIASLALAPAMLAVAVGAKRVLIGRYRIGRHPAFGSFHVRHWIVTRCARRVPWAALQGTVFQVRALRALGARIGARVHVARGVDLAAGGWDLLDLGDRVTLDRDARIGLVEWDAGKLAIGPVTIGDAATLEPRAGVAGHVELGAGAMLTALSALESGTNVPAGECWDGVPARFAHPTPAAATSDDREIGELAHGVRTLLVRGLVGIARAGPSVGIGLLLVAGFAVTGSDVVGWLDRPTWSWSIAVAALAFAGAVPLDLLLRAVLLRVIPPVPAGDHRRWGATFLRLDVRMRLLEGAGVWLSGSLLWPVWLRLAGMRVGRGSEISTITDVLPELVSIGEECFFADGIYLGAPRIHDGVVTTAPTGVGRSVFLGNHVVVRAGTQLGDGVLIGVSTVADDTRMTAGTSWFGHPPFALPRREIVTVDRRLTHEPGPLRFVNRVGWELARFALPWIGVLSVLWWCRLIAVLTPRIGVVPAMPSALLLASAALAVFVIGAKWLLLGRARPGQHALWSCWCSRWDFLYVAWGFLARRSVAQLEGTLLLPWYLRAMGVRVGRRVVLGAGFAQVVDPDMLVLDDGATVDGLFQAHSFEDRVLKIDRVRVRAGATIRRGAVLMYGADVGARARVGAHSVVMKRERLSPGRDYCGSPTSAG